MWTRLWWKQNSNRAKSYSFTHWEHPLLAPGPVWRESNLWHSSGAFLLLLLLFLLFLVLLFFLLTCFSSLARPLHLTDNDLKRRLTWEIPSLAMGTFAWIAKAPHEEQNGKNSQLLHTQNFVQGCCHRNTYAPVPDIDFWKMSQMAEQQQMAQAR